MRHFLFHVLWAHTVADQGSNVSFFILKQAGLPEKEKYKQFYIDNNIHAVDEVPGDISKASNVDVFVLSAALSNGFQHSHPADEVLQKQMAHIGVGFRVYDNEQNEMFRISASFWACLAQRVDLPFLLRESEKYCFFNRAIVAFSLDRNNWENGYWSKTQYLKTITVHEYRHALHHMKVFAYDHPYLQGWELWTRDSQLLSPAVTCNTFVQDIIWKVLARDVWADGILAQGYATVVLKNPALEAKTNLPVSFLDWRWSRCYDEHGSAIFKERDSCEIHSSRPKKFYLRNNFNSDLDLLRWVKLNMILPEASL